MRSPTRSRTLGCVFFFNDTATTEIYTLSLHDALPISTTGCRRRRRRSRRSSPARWRRSEEHTSELQSRVELVCRLLLETKQIRAVTPLAQLSSCTFLLELRTRRML